MKHIIIFLYVIVVHLSFYIIVLLTYRAFLLIASTQRGVSLLSSVVIRFIIGCCSGVVKAFKKCAEFSLKI